MPIFSHSRVRYFSLFVICICCACSLQTSPAFAAEPAKFMMQANVNNISIEGQPLVWSKKQIFLLGRDGSLYDFAPRDAKNAHKTGTRFFGYSNRELKQKLAKEFGPSMNLSTTNHYIVVHPAGQGGDWANRFEDLYRSFKHYFQVRGFRSDAPKYPLVAIVFKSRNAYYTYSAAQGIKLQSNMLGHYDQKTNRVYLYDLTQEGGKWSSNVDTIIHEATHQTAYNSGIHTRFTGSPRWLVEGLATMFEAKGVWDSKSFQTQKDRINRERLRDFNSFKTTRRHEGFMQEMISSDTIFKRDSAAAYAEAWALSFYLSETQPKKYTSYLAKTANRKMFTSYSPQQRIADFQAAFGKNLPWIESQFLKYMERIK